MTGKDRLFVRVARCLFRTQPPEPEWLRSLLTDDFFISVEAVTLNATQVTDAGLENLRELTMLQELSLANRKVTDAGLKNLRGLTALQWLDLSNTQVTDAGLDSLRGLIALQ